MLETNSIKILSALPLLVTFITYHVHFLLVYDFFIRKWNFWSFSHRLTFYNWLWSSSQGKLFRLNFLKHLKRKFRDWSFNLFNTVAHLQFFFQLHLSISMSLNVPFEYRVVISQTHFPIMHNIMVDNIEFIGIILYQDLIIDLHKWWLLLVYKLF